MKKLIAGNWKMNGTAESAHALIQDILTGIEKNKAVLDVCDFTVCPPYLHLQIVKDAINAIDADVELGAQDCANFDNGAYTGNISAPMLRDFGCSYVILGHSERRQYHGETDKIVAEKAAKAHEMGLVSIICVGEKEDERAAGYEEDVVEGQLKGSLPASATADNTVIAYEPVWAIGTGKTATPDDVAAMHRFIREKLKEQLEDFSRMRILYGGSVKPDNAATLFKVPDVDGALIGGASLKAADYLAIAAAAI